MPAYNGVCHIKCYPSFCLLMWKLCCPDMCVCLLIFYIMSHCLHHVDFLRIVQSWISTNGRHWHMTKRSGDLHQHDADDEGTLWRKDTECVYMGRDEHKGLDESTMLWSGKVLRISQRRPPRSRAQMFCLTVKKWTFTMNMITEL